MNTFRHPLFFLPLVGFLSACGGFHPIYAPPSFRGATPDSGGLRHGNDDQLEFETTCVINNAGQLTEVQALYDRHSGTETILPDPGSLRDWVVVGRSTNYAGAATWFLHKEPVTVRGTSYLPLGLPQTKQATDRFAYIGEVRGVSVFRRVGSNSIFIPVRRQCVFQEYVSSRRPIRPNEGEFTTPQTHWSVQPGRGRIVADEDEDVGRASLHVSPRVRSGHPASARRHRESVGEGDLKIQLPERMRQGQNTLVAIRIHRQPQTDALAIRANGKTIDHTAEGMVILHDTILVSSVMRVRLEPGDTIDGPNFIVIPRHRDEKQTVRGDVGASWFFVVQPLKSGKQPLDLTIDLITRTDTTTLSTTRRTIMVQVDPWFVVRRFFHQHVLPISVTTLLSFIGFLAKRYWPGKKNEMKPVI